MLKYASQQWDCKSRMKLNKIKWIIEKWMTERLACCQIILKGKGKERNDEEEWKNLPSA